jgi:hypothetical protein
VIGFVDDRAQRARLEASGMHMSPDAAHVGEVTASLVEVPWLPFD